MMVVFYVFYYVLGAATAYALTQAKWHRRMANGYKALRLMALTDHIPSPSEVNQIFGGKP